ncbi:MAG: LytTR family DNA-binding domain-containing protein [Bacteroidales bacterium]|nr:LytTR family DNA-binding domain-containing protein [Bacteroidales bacterium]
MDQQITVMVVDDDLRSREVLTLHLRAIPGIKVIDSARSADEALAMLMMNVPDILFLDVEMPGKTGFDLVSDLKRLNISTCIVFQTAYDKYAIQAIKHAAFDYLMKPIDPEELREVVSKYRQSQKLGDFEEKIDRLLNQLNPHKKIKLHTHKGFILIDTDDIYYCEADWNYSIVHYGNQQKETLSINLGKLVEMLPVSLFHRISRSIVINMRYLTRISRKTHKCHLVVHGVELSFSISSKMSLELEERLG